MPLTADLTRTATELRIVLGQLVRRLRAENALPLHHVTVLSRLERVGPQTTSALAAAERMRPQSMAHTLGELGKEGLVDRRPDPIDRRQIIVALTDAGRELLTRERNRREGWLTQAIAEQLTADERQVLVRAVPLLRRLVDS
ncbi:MAG TPA: MarR family transcriptional regulator [Gaiellaceae bacterium]